MLEIVINILANERVRSFAQAHLLVHNTHIQSTLRPVQSLNLWPPRQSPESVPCFVVWLILVFLKPEFQTEQHGILVAGLIPVCKWAGVQGPKRGINTKNFARTAPSQNPPRDP